MRKEAFLFLMQTFLFWGCATFHPYNANEREQKGRAPVIVDFYAPEIIRPGVTWKVYVHARDEDGDMNYIAAMLWHAGVGYYSTDFTWVKDKDSKEFSGYIFLNTPADTLLLWDRLELALLIRDDRWNRSEIIYIPLQFDMVKPQKLPEKWQPYSDRRLGAMMIDIVSSHRYNSGR